MIDDKYLWGIVSAVIGGVSGIFAAWWRSKYTIKEQDFSRRVEDLCESITKLEELSCKFWNDPAAVGSDSISKPYILGVKTKIELIMNHLQDKDSSFYTQEISTKLAAFFMSCTGDDFESKSTVAEPERQRQILISGEKLKIEIMRTRNKLY